MVTQYRNQQLTCKEDAEAVASFINFEIRAGSFRWETWFPQDRRKFACETLLPRYQTHYRQFGNLRPITLQTYDRIFKIVLPHLTGKDARELERCDFNWILKNHGNGAYAKSIRGFCRSFLNWCHDELGKKEMGERINLPKIILPKVTLKLSPLMA